MAISKVIADEVIQEMNREKNLKYDYQVNESMLISHLKNHLVKCLLGVIIFNGANEVFVWSCYWLRFKG